MARRPKHQGRFTPKVGAPGQPRPSKQPGPPGQVGRRPSSPLFLLMVGAVWIVCGIVALTMLTAGWKLIPSIVFIGVGLFFIRGAATTVMRRDARDG